MNASKRSPANHSKRAAVVFNPSKKFDFDLPGLVNGLCREAGWREPLWLETSVEDTGVGQGREALEAGADVVIAAGGDGTVRCVGQALAGTDTPLGIIPLGTGNLLARNLGMDVDDHEAAVQASLTGTGRRIDVVRATLDHAATSQVFLVMAGLGFDAAVMADTNDRLKDRVGWLAYVDAGIRNLPGKPEKVRIAIDGSRPLVRRLRSVMCGNCGKLQGGLEIFPGARFDDGILDLLTLAPSRSFGWLGVVAGLLRRGHGKDPAIEYFQGKAVAVSTVHPLQIQLDGDPIGMTSHLEMRVDHGALIVRVSQS